MQLLQARLIIIYIKNYNISYHQPGITQNSAKMRYGKNTRTDNLIFMWNNRNFTKSLHVLDRGNMGRSAVRCYCTRVMIHSRGMILHRVAGAASEGVSFWTLITDHLFVDEFCATTSNKQTSESNNNSHSQIHGVLLGSDEPPSCLPSLYKTANITKFQHRQVISCLLESKDS